MGLAVVRAAVLGRGKTWLDRAVVVNDWYVSAYQPLANGRSQCVGMLYVGYLERPFTLLKYSVLAGIGLVFFGGMIVAARLVLRWAGLIFRPVEQTAQTMRGHCRQDRGLAAPERRAGCQSGRPHPGAAVCPAAKLRTEKMAAVGQLTASIAHEVNNPIAVIQGNQDLMRELLGAQAQPVQAELRLVDEQIERMRLIVTQLLQFARPNEFAGCVEAMQPARALAD